MKILIVVLAVVLSGCAIHYQNNKSITGKGKEITTPYGTVEGAKANFTSTLDVWIPYKFNEIN